MSIDRGPYKFAVKVGAFGLVCAISIAAFDAASSRLSPEAVAWIPNAPNDLAALHRAQGRVLYLGDSTVWTTTQGPHPRTLHRALGAELGEDVAALAAPGFAPDTFLAQLRYIARANVQPRAVVIPINLRAFCPEWELSLRSNAPWS